MTKRRVLELTDQVRTLLLKLHILDDCFSDLTIDARQIRDVEEALNCKFPDPIIALFASKADGLLERGGVRIEDVYDNTNRAHEFGHSKDMVAIGRDPDDLCFYCVSRNPPGKTNPGVTDCDNLDGSAKFYSLTEWLEYLIEREVECLERPEPEVDEATLADFALTVYEVK